MVLIQESFWLAETVFNWRVIFKVLLTGGGRYERVNCSSLSFFFSVLLVMGTVPSYEDEEEWMMVHDLPVGEACVLEVVHPWLLKSLLLWKETNKHLLFFEIKSKQLDSTSNYLKFSILELSWKYYCSF